MNALCLNHLYRIWKGIIFEIEVNQKNELQIIESELENTRAKVNLELQKIMEEHPYYVDDYKEAYKKVALESMHQKIS